MSRMLVFGRACSAALRQVPAGQENGIYCSLRGFRTRTGSYEVPLDEPWLVKVRNAIEEQEPPEPEPPRPDERLKFHVFKRLSPWNSKEELGRTLKNSIIHQQDGIIAFNKPFGVGVRNLVAREEDRMSTLEKQGKEVVRKDSSVTNLYHTRGVDSCEYTLEDMIPVLRRELSEPNLDLVKSAEKFSSGVAIFSTNEKGKTKIQDSIRKAKPSHQLLNSFMIVSANIPLSWESNKVFSERVGIGLIENKLMGTRIPIIQREIAKRAVQNQVVVPISVELRVISKNTFLNVCCTEIKVSGSKSNFLRVYYADIVSPILGDHLYSSRVKSVGGFMTALNPLSVRVGAGHQRLTRELNIALGFKISEDTLIIPPHIHLQSVCLPNFNGKGKSLELKAPLPQYFLWTCKKLGLKLL